MATVFTPSLATLGPSWATSREVLLGLVQGGPPRRQNIVPARWAALEALGVVTALTNRHGDLLRALADLLAAGDPRALATVGAALDDCGYDAPDDATLADLLGIYRRVKAAEERSPARACMAAWGASLALKLGRPGDAACFLADADDEEWDELYYDLALAVREAPTHEEI